MAVFDFTVPIYAFDQWSANATTNNTVSYPVGTTFSLNSNAVLAVIDGEDDDGNPAGSADNLFSDGFIDTPANGSAPSTANNDQVLTQAITLNGNQFQVGDQIELELAFETTTGETFWVIRIDGVNVGISGPVLPTPGTTYEVGSSADAQATPFENVPCFTDGAMVETPTGPVAIETLREGDLVMTLDHGPQSILWVGAVRPSLLEMVFFPKLQPVLIKRDALGPNVPNADMEVSSKHRIMLCSDMATYLFGEREVLVSAKDMLDDTTVIKQRHRRSVTYRHILLARHEILIVNGMYTESLYPGSDLVSPEAKMERELMDEDRITDMPFARPTPKGREARLLTV